MGPFDHAELPPFFRPRQPGDAPGTLARTWDVESTGDDVRDWELGEQYAEQAIAYAHAVGSPFTLLAVVFGIMAKMKSGDESGAIEAGFFNRIARAAFAGGAN